MRHENGFGSIICLDKSGKKRRRPWAVRITTGWQGDKQIRKYLGYYKSEKEALLALADYHKNGYNVDLSKLTLVEVYDRWISRIENKVGQNVINAHNMSKNRFGTMANITMSKIKADQLQDWMDGIELKAGTKRRMKSTMIQLYKYAIRNDIVQTNYAEHIEITEKSEKTGKIFTREEIQLLWDNVDNSTAQWILILIYTGMRIGELLTITRDTMYLDERYMIGGSKTEAGRDRVIPIHRDILPLVKERLGDSKYLIQDKKGHQLNYHKALREFKAYAESLKLEHNPHDCRKTAVSLMHSSGIPMETVRIIAGHSGKGITETVYLYKEPYELVEAIDMIQLDCKIKEYR